ncbi:MAG: GAF domain-containing protein, partial [Acidobacteriota bacterium]
MKPPPAESDETARLSALGRYEILGTAPQREFDDLARLAALVCDAPIARISFVDREREWHKARIGLEETEGPRDDSFCGHAILGNDVLVVPDAAKDERFAGISLVAGAAGVRFYAGAPLVTPDGQTLGTLCVMDSKPRELDASQVEALRTLSRQVVAHLELRRRLLLERAQAREALEDKEANLKLVASQMPAVLWSTDLGLTLTSSMGKALGEMNQRPGQFVGVPLTEYFQTSDPEFPPLVAHRRALLGESVSFEVEWLGRTFASHVEPLRNADGTIRGVIGVALDITRQKRA